MESRGSRVSARGKALSIGGEKSQQRDGSRETTRVYQKRRRRFFQIDGGRPRLKKKSRADSSQRDAGPLGGRCFLLLVPRRKEDLELYV